MFLTTFPRKRVILSEVDFVRITAVVMLNIDLYYESRRKNFVTNGIDFIWGLQQFGRDFSDRLGETAREVYEGTRPSRHFEGR